MFRKEDPFNIPSINRSLDRLGRALGSPAGEGASTAVDSTILGPWNNEVNPNSFFPPIEIQGNRWDKLYPYRILVVAPVPGQKEGSTVKYQALTSGTVNAVFGPAFQDSSSDFFRVNFFRSSNKWEYHLPITPQQISITNQFTNTLDATQRGVVEQHGGTKFKMISMSGSFGVWPNKGSVGQTAPTPPSSFETLFGGSIAAFSGLTNQVANLIDTARGNSSRAKPSVGDEKNAIGNFAGTGYAHALLLDQFLEQYAEAKTKKEWAGYRLALDIPKQNQTYLVTPLSFTHQQDSNSPNEHRFSLQLKAYRRIKLADGVANQNINTPTPLETNTLQRVLQSVTELRRTLASAFNLVRAVRSDFQTPFNALRELSMFTKGLSGLTSSIAELPSNIIEDSKLSIADSLSNIDSSTLVSSLSPATAISINAIKSFKGRMEGQNLSSAFVQSSVLTQTDPINKIFSNQEQNFDLFNLLDVESVPFSFQARAAINNETARVSLLTADDIKTHKKTLQDLAYQISNNFGTGDETFSRVYGRPEPRQRLQEITIDEYDILKKLYDTILSLGSLVITDAVDRNQNAAYEFVKSEALDAGIPFEDSVSKVRAPVPFGLTIEQIAARYLGDQERWLEIVALNNLKSPYIDEVGFTLPFLSNGDGRQLNIQSSTNLFIGQVVTIFSNSQPKQRRRIINIERINENNFLITLDGLDNLSGFTTTDQASLLAYLPGTVNSQDQIFIPSNIGVPDDLVTRPVPAAQDDELTGLSKIDFLLTDDNDIAIDSFGDFRLSFGLTNIFQALKLKFVTEPGQLLRHPDFGSGLRQGASTADISANNVYNIISSLIAQDPRFSGIESLQVIKEGPILRVNLSVFIANGLGVYPISFQLAS